MYDEYEKFFLVNSNIGRRKLAKKCNISENEARIICKFYKNKMKKNNSNIIKKGIAVGDIHVPYENKACMNILYNFMDDFEPDYFIFGGDTLDFDQISTYNTRGGDIKARLLEGRRIKNDYGYLNEKIINIIENKLPENAIKVFLTGNHEYRITALINTDPHTNEGYIELENNINLTDWKLLNINEAYTIGHMNFIHGDSTTMWHSKKNIDTYTEQIFSFHVHTNQVFTKITPLNSLPQQGVSVGCMCNKNPEWMKNKPNAWLNQFLYFYIFDDGSFSYYTPIIVNGKAVINDKIYRG